MESRPMQRTADVTRNTNETRIRVRLNLDGTGVGVFKTGKQADEAAGRYK